MYVTLSSMNIPKATLFDLDDTLAMSFQPPTPDMLTRLQKLLALMPVAIVSAAGFPRIQRDFLDIIADSPHIHRFYIFPNSSAECFRYQEGAWRLEYDFLLTSTERENIVLALKEAIKETGILEEHPKYEPRIIDRDVQIAYAALGLDASEEDKIAWDPDQSKRIKLKRAIEQRIPEFEVLVGGKTTVDITRKGITKAYGVKWLAEHLNIPIGEMLYVGDALYPGGNDAVVIPTGITTKSVNGPDDTARIIDEVIAAS